MSDENLDCDSQYKSENFIQNEASHASQSNSRGPTQESSHSYDDWNYANVFFATEKINLPRDKVVEVLSSNSSPSHGFKQDISPITQKTNKGLARVNEQVNIGSFENQDRDQNIPQQRKSLRPGTISPSKVHGVFMKKPPTYDPTIDYYKEFWRVYLQNENLVSDIDQTAHLNNKMHRKIFNIKDFYENTLVP